MQRLINIFKHNYFFHAYTLKNARNDYTMWFNILDEAFAYLKNNITDRKYKNLTTKLTAMADIIYPDFHPVYNEDSPDQFTKENARLNEPLYPAMLDILKYIDKIMWKTIKETKVPFINGTYHDGDFVLTKLISFEKTVSVPGYCKFIDNNCLYLCKNMEELIFEEGVKSIQTPVGKSNRQKLKKVVFPSTTEYIALHSFTECKNLEEVVFLSNDTDFSYCSFEETKWFKNYMEENNHKGMHILAGTLFYYDGEDKELFIPDGVKNIGDFSLKGCSFENIHFPTDLKNIGIHTFYGCINLKKVIIPDQVSTIGYCFQGCRSLKTVYLPEHTQIVAITDTFYGCHPQFTIYGYRNNKSMRYIAENSCYNYKFLD